MRASSDISLQWSVDDSLFGRFVGDRLAQYFLKADLIYAKTSLSVQPLGRHIVNPCFRAQDIRSTLVRYILGIFQELLAEALPLVFRNYRDVVEFGNDEMVVGNVGESNQQESSRFPIDLPHLRDGSRITAGGLQRCQELIRLGSS